MTGAWLSGRLEGDSCLPWRSGTVDDRRAAPLVAPGRAGFCIAGRIRRSHARVDIDGPSPKQHSADGCRGGDKPGVSPATRPRLVALTRPRCRQVGLDDSTRSSLIWSAAGGVPAHLSARPAFTQQQQPGADKASSESHEYGQDQDIKSGLDSEHQEKAGDPEQDRGGVGGRYRVED